MSQINMFDGDTYEPEHDYIRLNSQLGKVLSLMSDGKWRTIPQITDAVGWKIT